jgi:hypothetical protein
MAGNTVESTDSDIRFKAANVMSQSSLVTTQTNKDVYNDYWSRSLNNIYNKGARLQTAYFYLNSQDVADFKYNDKVFVKDSYWYINKISSYAIGVDVSTKVELIKVIETLDDSVCNLTYSSANLDGTTNWLDSAGASASPTALCCEGEGLTMVGTECLWNLNQVDETNEPPVVYNEEDDVVVGGNASNIVNGKATTEVQINGIITKIGEGDPKEGDVLTWDDTLNRTEWVAPSGSGVPAGSDTQIQFNDSGSFGGNSDFTYNKINGRITASTLIISNVLKLSGDTIKDSGGNDIITSDGNGVITMAEGHISIGGLNANLELNNGSDIVLGADALGGSSSTIMYYDAGGAGRQFIRVDSTNKVVICNRATNGTVEIKANTSSAGGGGETDVVTFKYNEAEFDVPITSEGLMVNPQSLTIKVFPSEFKNNADSGYPNYIHDSVSNKLSTRGKDNGDDFYAFIEIPAGHKVTHVKVYASSSVSSAVEVSSFNYKTGADNNVASTTFAFNENKSITNIVGSATQDLVIKCSPASNSVYVYGAEVTLAIV